MKRLLLLMLLLLSTGCVSYQYVPTYENTTTKGCGLMIFRKDQLKNSDWSGECKDGKVNGPGSLTYLSNGRLFKFTGTFIEGFIAGKGELRYFGPNGEPVLESGFFGGDLTGISLLVGRAFVSDQLIYEGILNLRNTNESNFSDIRSAELWYGTIYLNDTDRTVISDAFTANKLRLRDIAGASTFDSGKNMMFGIISKNGQVLSRWLQGKKIDTPQEYQAAVAAKFPNNPRGFAEVAIKGAYDSIQIHRQYESNLRQSLDRLQAERNARQSQELAEGLSVVAEVLATSASARVAVPVAQSSLARSAASSSQSSTQSQAAEPAREFDSGMNECVIFNGNPVPGTRFVKFTNKCNEIIRILYWGKTRAGVYEITVDAGGNATEQPTPDTGYEWMACRRSVKGRAIQIERNGPLRGCQILRGSVGRN